MPPAAGLPAYLQRIGYEGPVMPTVETLRAMHRAHFLHVPFENLDIQRGVSIVVDLDNNYDKIVTRGRGGFCLEVTSLFAWALREIGFKVEILGGRVLLPTGQLGEPLSHMALAVYLDEPWLADVGFGGRVAQPLRLSERGPQTSGASTYAVSNDGDHWLVTCLDPWLAPQAPRTYVLTLQPRELSEFAAVCEWLQTSPESAFTRGDVVSLSTDHGRVSYSPGRLTIVSGDSREEREVVPEEVGSVLSEHFGILL